MIFYTYIHTRVNLSFKNYTDLYGNNSIIYQTIRVHLYLRQLRIVDVYVRLDIIIILSWI
jgi:hypothetical protein